MFANMLRQYGSLHIVITKDQDATWSMLFPEPQMSLVYSSAYDPGVDRRCWRLSLSTRFRDAVPWRKLVFHGSSNTAIV